MQSDKKTVLVTGCAGFIGSHLTERLLEEGWKVIGIDNFSDYYNPKIKVNNLSEVENNSNFRLIQADITNEKEMAKIFLENNIQRIVHLAGCAGVRASFKDPVFYNKVNVVGTINLLRLSTKHKIKQFVFASSSSVYGTGRVPFKENQIITKVSSPYAATKRISELVCKSWSLNYKLPVVCLRFFTVYGARGRPDMAIFKFTKNISAGKPIEKYGNGGMKRDFTYVDDIVQGIVLTLKKDFKFEIINLGSGFPVTLNKLIQTIERVVGKKAIIKERPVPKGDVQITFADNLKAKRLLEWTPKVSLDEGIERFVKWFKVNK